MDKVKNIRQASKAMKERFPGVYVSVQTVIDSHPKSKDKTRRRVYTARPTGKDDLGVSGKGESWDEAFARLDKQIAEVTDERSVD